MQHAPTRQQIAITFMIGALVATLVLGGAVAYELGRSDRTVRVVGGTSAGAARPSGNAATEAAAATAEGGPAGDVTAGAAAASGASTAGGSNSAGRTSAAAATKGSVPAAGAAGTRAVTGGVITVGGLFDETGPVDATVERDTVRSYFNLVNEQGGVNGKQLQLKDCDSKFNSTDAANCANKLIRDDKVFAVVGWAGVGEDTTVKAFNDAGIPVVGGLGTPNEFKYPLSFPVSANFVTYGTAMGNRAKELDMKDVGLVIVNVSFIFPAKAELERTLKANGIAIKSTQVVEATKPNYADVVLDFQTKGVKAVIAALDPFSYQRLFQSMQGAGFRPPVLGLGLDKGSANPNPSQPDKGYGRFVEGMHSLTPMLPPSDHQNDPAVRLYLDTVKRFFPNQVDPLDVYTQQSWTAAQLFVDALRRAGPNPTQKGLVDALNTTVNFRPGLTPVALSFKPGLHDPNRCFWMLKNKGYVWTTVTQPKCF